MDTFEIYYSPQKGVKWYYPLGFSAYAGIISLIFCIKGYIAENYDLWFYCFVLLFILSVTVVLSLTLFRPKPLVCITTQTLSFHLDRKNVFYDWDNIREINLGIGSLKIENINGKTDNIHLESIRYNELKLLKSKIIELCEGKKIPYKNDY